MNEAVLSEFDCAAGSEGTDPSADTEEPGGRNRRRRGASGAVITRPTRTKTPLMSDSERFYSSLCLPFPHEPTRDRFRIIHNDVVGEGVIALVDFEPGDIVFTFAGPLLDHQTLFTLQIEPGRYIEDPLVMGKVLHSCDPNMIADMSRRTFWACKPIRANDYLFMDYESTEDELFRSFNCCCGAEHCRGEIRGRRFLTPEGGRFIQSVRDIPNAVPL